MARLDPDRIPLLTAMQVHVDHASLNLPRVLHTREADNGYYGRDLGQIQKTLNHYGFPAGPVDGYNGPKTAHGTRAFQAAFAGGRSGLAELHVDGIPGPLTARALHEAPWLAPHFQVAEVQSRGDRTTYVRRELLVALEELREVIRRPLVLRSAYRDPAHNRRVGGARWSVHMWGLAADLAATNRVTLAQARKVGAFSGIGTRESSGIVMHVDLRHLIGRVTTYAPDTPDWPGTSRTPANPARWTYPT